LRLLPPWAVGNHIRELYDRVIYRRDADEQHDEEKAPKQEWLFKPQQIRAAAAPKLSNDSAMYAEYDKCRSGDDTYESGQQCRSSGLSYEHECRLTTKLSDGAMTEKHAGARQQAVRGARPPAAEHFMWPQPLQRRVRRHDLNDIASHAVLGRGLSMAIATFPGDVFLGNGIGSA